MENKPEIAEVFNADAGAAHLQETRRGGAYAFHFCSQNGMYLPFDQHVKAAEAAKTELLTELNDKLALLTVSDPEQLAASLPFHLTARLEKWSGCHLSTPGQPHTPCDACLYKTIASKTVSTYVAHSENRDEKLTALLARLPKLVWGLRKAFCNKKATRFAFYFEWTMSVKTARVSELNKILEGTKKLKLKPTSIQKLKGLA